MSRGVLLVNLGTPASADVTDVRRYLGAFLNDPYVIDLPTPLRQIVVQGFILPFRPRRSAAAYSKIWDAAGSDTGSPLLHYSRKVLQDLRTALPGIPCELAMRYGEPEIQQAIHRLSEDGVREILLIVLYPQHADSTRKTSIEAVRKALPEDVALRILPPFFEDPAYLDAQADLIRRHLPESWDHLLLSFHGLPERHLIRTDPTGSHCLQTPDCCEVPSTAHPTCYRHQVLATSSQLVARLDVPRDRYTVSFQSRLGRLPWLSPYTDQVLARLPEEGVGNLVVACPAFVADNLETLEEIGIAGREIFLRAGGERLTLIPCLNDDARWIDVLADWSRNPPDGDQTSSARSETAR